jgi:hypothetical protein
MFDHHVGKNNSQSTGFEPVREDPNRFLVCRLNHSAKTAPMRGNGFSLMFAQAIPLRPKIV